MRKSLRTAAVLIPLVASALGLSTAGANATTWTFYKGSAVTNGGCKEWLNYSGHYIQMLGESWGDDCQFYLTIYHNGTLSSNLSHTINGSGTYASGAHWDSSAAGYEAYLMVCDRSSGGCSTNGPL